MALILAMNCFQNRSYRKMARRSGENVTIERLIHKVIYYSAVFGSIFYESVLIWNSFWKSDFYRADVSKELGLSAEPNCRLIRCRFPRFSQTQPPLKPDDKYSELPTLLPNETDSFKFINLEFLLVFLDEESILFLSRAIAIEFSSGTCRLERLLSLCRCGAISGVTARGRF